MTHKWTLMIPHGTDYELGPVRIGVLSGIPETMRVVFPWRVAALLYAVFAVATPSSPQQAPDPFRWMDFHSQKDQDIVVWVTHALAVEKWTAIREIGVQYDAALVVTTFRATPESAANRDSFQVWSISLTNHLLTPILKGYNLRWLDWMTFKEGGPQELPILYDSCAECAPDTYFTAFHFDMAQHAWVARWMRGGQGISIASANQPAGVTWTQVYAGLAEPNGRQLIGTWSHFDYGNQKRPEDFVYRYDLDPFSGLERTQLLNAKEAESMKLRLCRAGDALPGLSHGQDSPLCQQHGGSPRPERKPVTTPPINNRGRSTPGAH